MLMNMSQMMMLSSCCTVGGADEGETEAFSPLNVFFALSWSQRLGHFLQPCYWLVMLRYQLA